jgi:hypothetical protein
MGNESHETQAGIGRGGPSAFVEEKCVALANLHFSFRVFHFALIRVARV